MSELQVSLCIAAKGYDEALVRCLKCAAGQTALEHAEILVCSSVNRQEMQGQLQQVMDECPSLKEHLRILQDERNLGVSSARNKLLEEAKGKYIAFSDADDTFEADYLERMIHAAEDNAADMVTGSTKMIYTSGVKHVNKEVTKNIHDYIDGLLRGNYQGWLHGKLFLRNVIEENHIRFHEDINMCEDLIFVVEVLTKADIIESEPAAVYRYDLLNDNSLSKVITSKKAAEVLKADSELMKLVGNDYKEAMDVRFAISKMWIIASADVISRDFLRIYREKKLYHLKKLPVTSRLFLFLCDREASILVGWIVKIVNGHMKESRKNAATG